jgi:phosphoglycerate dehydrogenase-like enzyme
MNQYRLAILDDYQGVAEDFAPWSSLKERGVTVTVFGGHFGSEAETLAALAGFDVVIAMRERTPFPRSVIGQLPRLKLLVTTGAANAAIDLQAAADHGVVVCGTGGSPTAAPELTWALLLAFARNLTAEEASLRSGHWQAAIGFELSGKTLGIVGLGKIGTRIAAYGRAFGMNVLAWSQNLTELLANVSCSSSAPKVSWSTPPAVRSWTSRHLPPHCRKGGSAGQPLTCSTRNRFRQDISCCPRPGHS